MLASPDSSTLVLLADTVQFCNTHSKVTIRRAHIGTSLRLPRVPNHVDPTLPTEFPRRVLAALSARLRAFYDFLCHRYKADADTVLRRAEEQHLRGPSPPLSPR